MSIKCFQILWNPFENYTWKFNKKPLPWCTIVKNDTVLQIIDFMPWILTTGIDTHAQKKDKLQKIIWGIYWNNQFQLNNQLELVLCFLTMPLFWFMLWYVIEVELSAQLNRMLFQSLHISFLSLSSRLIQVWHKHFFLLDCSSKSALQQATSITNDATTQV